MEKTRSGELLEIIKRAQEQYVEPLKEALHVINEECERVVEDVLKPALKDVTEALKMYDVPVGDHDQWLSEGNCKECRRAPYCQHLCKAHKKLLRRELIEGLKVKKSPDVIRDVAEKVYGE